MKTTSLLSIFPRYFFLLFAVFFAVGFFAFYDSFRAYRAEAELVVVSRGPALPSGIAETLSHVPETLAFYDRLRDEHSNISDPWVGETSASRKQAWDRVIESSRVAGSGSIRLSVIGPDPSQASALLNASIETLYGFSGRLYNRDTEADVRLLEEAIVYPFVTNLWALISLSVACALLVALLLSWVISIVSGTSNYPRAIGMFSRRKLSFLERAKEKIRPVGSFPDISHEEAISESAPELSALPKSAHEGVLDPLPVQTDQDTVPEFEQAPEKEEQSDIDTGKMEHVSVDSNEGAQAFIESNETFSRNVNEPEDIWEKSRPAPIVLKTRPVAAQQESHTGAPGNLVTVSAKDFTWEKFLFQNEEKNEKKNESFSENTEAAQSLAAEGELKKREPTPEELKARLNQLLRGEL